MHALLNLALILLNKVKVFAGFCPDHVMSNVHNFLAKTIYKIVATWRSISTF